MLIQKLEEYIDMLKNDLRLDCQHLKDESDTLHAAVLVQNTIFDVATKCFGENHPLSMLPFRLTSGMTGKKLQTRYLRLVRSGAGREDRMAARKAYRTMVRSKKRQHKLKQVEEL
jgi:hypothetical protein